MHQIPLSSLYSLLSPSLLSLLSVSFSLSSKFYFLYPPPMSSNAYLSPFLSLLFLSITFFPSFQINCAQNKLTNDWKVSEKEGRRGKKGKRMKKKERGRGGREMLQYLSPVPGNKIGRNICSLPPLSSFLPSLFLPLRPLFPVSHSSFPSLPLFLPLFPCPLKIKKYLW